MSNLSVTEQRAFGEAVAKMLTPFPEDERLLLLVACLYGEGRAQGLTSGEISGFTARTCAIHEQGVSILMPRALECPLCGARPGVQS